SFFFSSRRRHTIFSRDWSSDVALPIWQLLIGRRLDVRKRGVVHGAVLEDVAERALTPVFIRADLSHRPAQPHPRVVGDAGRVRRGARIDRKSTRLNSSHVKISYAVFCLKKKT